jgi:hypothetical protein
MNRSTLKRSTYLFAGTAFLICAGGIFAQTLQTGAVLYQQAGAIGVQSASPGAVMSMSTTRVFGPEFFSPEVITGSPFSGTHQSHSLQVLGDGTRIERTESSQVYRDSQGRTRTETGTPGSRLIAIHDPVGGTMVTLVEATKTAEKSPDPQVQLQKVMAANPTTRSRVEVRNTAGGPVGLTQSMASGPVMIAPGSVMGVTKALISSTKPDTEELPIQNVNGVLAAGKKTTLTIAAGEIGNDRPILVVGETWYSNELQMMVKSSNSDPRFGDTTYELTNISRAEPDPSIFQVPADYTVADSKSFFNFSLAGPAKLKEKE